MTTKKITKAAATKPAAKAPAFDAIKAGNVIGQELLSADIAGRALVTAADTIGKLCKSMRAAKVTLGKSRRTCPVCAAIYDGMGTLKDGTKANYLTAIRAAVNEGKAFKFPNGSDKKAGKKTKTREACNPQEEAEAATYRTADGGFGVPVTAIKAALISAAHKDIGVEKTLIRKSLFIKCDDANNVLPMTCSEPRIREDHVKVGVSQADLRYRPEFTEWEVPLLIEYNTDNLRPEDIINLLNLAGFGVGICEWRPEKGGDCGRFQVREG